MYVFYGIEDGGLASEPAVTISCQARFCNLGWSLAGADLNDDGHPDLVVGSPFAPAGGEQRGMVQVLYAKEEYQGENITLSFSPITLFSFALIV